MNTPRSADSTASNTDPVWPADAVEVGRVIDAFGVQGWIKVHPFASDPKALFSSRRWYLQPALQALPQTQLPPLLHITHAKTHGDTVVASARELEDRDAARMLRGARVFVPRSSFPTAPDDEYYWVDLIGAEVFNREGALLGRVSALIDTGPHSVLCVRRADAGPEVPDVQAERLIPFVASYIDAVDMAARRIQVDWGLDY